MAARPAWGQSGAAAPPAIAEVTVRGAPPPSSKDIGAEDLRAQDARRLAGMFGEPFQAIGALPGVAATASGLPYFYVRGAPPADTGYFIDGVPLPTLFHVGPGPSVLPPGLVDHIEFFPGTAPARFGRSAGGVIAGSTTAPGDERRAEGAVRLFDSSALVESPLGEHTTALVAGRYGYPDALLSIFTPNLSLSYGDYTTRLTRTLGDADTISLLVIGAYDHEEDSSQNLIAVDSQFQRADLRYDHKWSGGSVRVATTLGHDRTSTPIFEAVDEVVSATSGRLRVEFDQQLGRGAHLSAGADVNATHYAYAFTGPIAQSSPIDVEEVGGVYADAVFRPAKGVELLTGIRFDGYRTSLGTRGSIDPRLAARVALAPRVRWVGTVGVAHQEPANIVPVPGLRVDPSGGLQAAYQLAQGAELTLPWAMRATLTGFYNADRNMSDFASDCAGLEVACSNTARVDGRTYGLEALVQRSLGRSLGGWLAYTLSRAERRVGATTFLSPFDRTHVLSAVLRYDLGGGVEAGVRVTAYSGRPGTAPSLTSDPSNTSAGIVRPTRAAGTFAQQRLPSFYRLDLRADKRWELGPDGMWLAAVAEFFDATLSTEAIGLECGSSSVPCRVRSIGPIALPSVGLEGGF